MGDASEENYLPGPLLDTREVWTFVEINQNIQIIALFTYIRFHQPVKQSVTTEENDPTQIVVETEGSFSDFPLVIIQYNLEVLNL